MNSDSRGSKVTPPGSTSRVSSASTQSNGGQTPLRPLVMPANVRAGQVIGLVEITGGLGSTIDVSRLAEEFGADIATLLPILDTAEMLGLVKTDKGDVSLTEIGLKFQKTAKRKIRLLRDTIANIEPFKSTIRLASGNRKGVSAREVAEELQKENVWLHHNQELNESLIQALLIHWAIYGELLTYNGKTGRFRKI